MTHLDHELHALKDSILEMWKLNIYQLEKCKESFIHFDKDIAHEIISNEKRVNAFELKIDRDCEDIFALFQPVAVDLRFVLAVLKINTNLERIGDMADSISRYIIECDHSFNKELIEKTQITPMFELASSMLSSLSEAFLIEDTKTARKIFSQDEILDKYNADAIHLITQYITEHPDYIKQGLQILSIIRKLERIGDQSKNIAEEIIFFVEAKVLKHRSKKEKKKE